MKLSPIVVGMAQQQEKASTVMMNVVLVMSII